MRNIDNALIGVAGVYYIASELSMRGFIALPTLRNTPGIDVLVTKPDGSWSANLQVKTSKNKVRSWPVGKNYDSLKGDDNYYVFLRYIKKEDTFEVFLEPAILVAPKVKVEIEEGKKRGCKEWGPCWSLPKDEKEIERLRDKWIAFGNGQAV